MLHDLLDKEVYKVPLIKIELEEDKNKNLEDVIREKIIKRQYFVLDELIVQKTAFRGYFQEIITGQVLPALVEDPSDIYGVKRSKAKIIYPQTNFFLYVTRNINYKIWAKIADLEDLKRYYQANANNKEFLDMMNKLSFDQTIYPVDQNEEEYIKYLDEHKEKRRILKQIKRQSKPSEPDWDPMDF